MSDENERGPGTDERNPEKSAGIALATLTEAREAIATLTLRFLKGEVKEYELRAAVYAINGMVKAMTHEKVAEIEKRLAALEKKPAGT